MSPIEFFKGSTVMQTKTHPIYRLFSLSLLSCVLCWLPQALAETVPEEPVALSVEALKKKVIELNRDLFILEEDLLFPANTQFVVFLSLDTGKFLALDSVKLKVDDTIVAAHLYTQRQQQALARGGMQRLYTGNLKQGAHEVTVFVEGMGSDKRPLKLAHSVKLEKQTDLKALEVRIRDQSSNYRPTLELVEWETQ